jgi:hypothetical protein
MEVMFNKVKKANTDDKMKNEELLKMQNEDQTAEHKMR